MIPARGAICFSSKGHSTSIRHPHYPSRATTRLHVIPAAQKSYRAEQIEQVKVKTIKKPIHLNEQPKNERLNLSFKILKKQERIEPKLNKAINPKAISQGDFTLPKVFEKEDPEYNEWIGRVLNSYNELQSHIKKISPKH